MKKKITKKKAVPKARDKSNETKKKTASTKTTNTTKKTKLATVSYKQIRSFVQSEMATDDGYTIKDNILIQSTYENANDLQKALIDDIFVSLCGWSMKSIIQDADTIEEEFDDGGYKYQDNDNHELDALERRHHE